MGRTGQTIRVAALGVLMLAALELGALAAFHWFEHWPSREEIQQSLAGAEAAGAAAESEINPDGEPVARGATNVAHPYLGYVRNPRNPQNRVNRLVVDEKLNEFGFFGLSPLAPRTEGVARVALTGGSVAEELFLYGRETLRQELVDSGAFGERDVEIVSIALAGFKQPQQLMALNYLWVLGASFDAVINLDGFNEAVLPFTENVPGKLAPSYPFRWNTVAARGIDPQAAMLVAGISSSEDELESWRRFFDHAPLRHSSFALASWHVLRSRIESERGALELELKEALAAAGDVGPQLRGPPFEYEYAEELFHHSVLLWKRASQQLWQLCQAQGVPYLQLLQPNQYVSGSKSFSQAERKAALAASTNATRYAAEAGYPRLIREGARLREAGLPFVDLTSMFADSSEPIYRDRCCHLLYPGYQTLARRAAEELAAAIRAAK